MSMLLLLYWWGNGLPEEWSRWYTAALVYDLAVQLPSVVSFWAKVVS